MRAKKSPRLISPAGLIKLITQAMMGAALGLAFTLTLVLINPAVAKLLNDGESGAVFVVILVSNFTIGVALTGAVFILNGDKES